MGSPRRRAGVELALQTVDRDGLGDLWLGWYVHRSEPTRPFERIWETIEDAQQLRIRDLTEDPRVWKAMSAPDPRPPDESHTRGVEFYERRYREAETVVFVAPAISVPEGLVLLDGMHRACALYRLAPRLLDADVFVLAAPPGLPDAQAGPRDTSLS
jgi:hypothetical protein